MTYKLVAGVILVFALGFGAGALGTGIWIKNRFEGFSSGHITPRKTFIMHHLTYKLDLNADEKAKVDAIVESVLTKLRNFHLGHRKEMDKIIEQAVLDIKKEVGPKQSAKIDEMMEHMNRFRKHRMNHRWGGWGGKPDRSLLEH